MPLRYRIRRHSDSRRLSTTLAVICVSAWLATVCLVCGWLAALVFGG